LPIITNELELFSHHSHFLLYNDAVLWYYYTIMVASLNKETTPVAIGNQTLLAKLLAKENIQVAIGKYKTAFFDVENRVLGLPTWNTGSKSVSDLLIGHEVGHALYTPTDAIARFNKLLPNVPFDIANIVEDIRIERMIRDTYPGLVVSFKAGYSYFITNDLFKISGVDINTLGFADRLNLHAKIGSQMHIPLSDIETAIYKRCLAANSYDDVLVICADIAKMIKKQSKKKQKSAKADDSADNEAQPSDDEGDFGVNDGKSSSPETELDSSNTKKPQTSSAAGNNSDEIKPADGESSSSDEKPANAKSAEELAADSALEEELTSSTLGSVEKALENLQDKNTANMVVNAPDIADMMKSIVPVKKVMEARRKNLNLYNTVMDSPETLKDWSDFSANTKKHVAVLVKEFERKKAAFQYSRATRSTTGSIDVNRLHSYKFEDQIFKSVTNLADAKNHGMVFFIDYSGSMGGTIGRVITQTLQLVAFCKAVEIPFEVYGFTSRYLGDSPRSCVLPGYNLDFSDTIIFQLLHSRMKRPDFETACRELKVQTRHNGYSGGAFNSEYEVMNGTPLNETIIVAHEIVRRFRATHNVQKMNTIFLTDGDACSIKFHKNKIGEEYEHEDKYPWNTVKILPVFGIKIPITNNRDLYADLINNLKKTCDTTAIGFFVSNNRMDYKNNCIAALRADNKNLSWSDAVAKFNILQKVARKEKCLAIKGGFGYTAYFVFDSKNDLDIADDGDTFESDEFSKDITQNSAQNKIARDFAKFNTEKRVSRVFLNKFAEFIA